MTDGPSEDTAPRRASRALDVGVAIVGLVAAAPVLAVVALAMRVARDPGPLLYRATRVGEHGLPITVHKIRTMRHRSSGLGITSAHDDRITPLGRHLRRHKLDELPQFLDVLRGDMSVVGPRPEDPRYVDWDDPVHRFVFSAKPGITGPAQISYRHEERMLAVDDPDVLYRLEIQPEKLRIDAEYLRRRTVRTDLGIIRQTVAAVLRRDPEGEDAA